MTKSGRRPLKLQGEERPSEADCSKPPAQELRPPHWINNASHNAHRGGDEYKKIARERHGAIWREFAESGLSKQNFAARHAADERGRGGTRWPPNGKRYTYETLQKILARKT